MFINQRSASLLRFHELRSLLTFIRANESPDPMTTPDDRSVATVRGLFVVNLYGAYEYSVNLAVERLLDLISSKSVAALHLEVCVHSVACDAEFDSLRSVGELKQWQRRLTLVRRQASPDPVVIPGSVFYQFLQNIRVASLEQVFDCLGVSASPVPDPRFRGYLDEVVEKRNQVAHGRESPYDAASGMRSPELERRLEAISKTCDHVFDSFEAHLASKAYVQQPHRHLY